MKNTKDWPIVPLREAVAHRKEFIEIDDSETYKRCRVQLHAQGVVLRDRVAGALIKTKKQQQCRPDDFLVAEIDAKMGGFGLVPTELDGAIVSSHYFLFTPRPDRLDPKFLGYYCRTPAFRDQVAPRGTTNYAAIRPNHVLEYTVPLPPLKEQQRIVARLDLLVTKIDETHVAKEQIEQKSIALLRSEFARIVQGAPRRRVSEVAPIVRRRADVSEDDVYPELGVRSFGRGTFHKPALDFLAVGSKRLYHIEPGDLVLSNVFAWEGAIAVAQPEDVGRFGSHRFITCVPRDGVALADFLCFYFLTPEGLAQIGEASPGGAGRNRTLGLKKLAELEVPVPAYDHQVAFCRLMAKMREMRSARGSQQTEVEALLPSILDRAFRGEL